MLTIDNLEFNFPNQQLFKNLNLTIDKGEFVYLVGKSGSGKTTLLQMIYMNLFPQDGYVELSGFNSVVIKRKDLPLLRRKIGIIFQDFKLLKNRTVYENLEFVLKVTGTPAKIIKRKVFTALTEVGLSHKQKNMPDTLSGGEKQRVAIARAIINQPELVLADEPTGNLDPETAREILMILKKINRRGTAVLCATHNYKLVEQNNSRIIKLDKGKIVNTKLESIIT
ncbi:MAG: cell division ATP-binding protein FtsE [Ignavibacteriae bacterium]|nr:cell division ATP-binding protein FtsE [Ignavibacteriota bacterium]NOG98206.1 cell division ATP-binding protein FtsE [Ignavibacteriota bacterium]